MAANVITFTAQAGTEGLAIARLVAVRLGFAFHAEDIVDRAAALGGEERDAIKAAERLPSFFVRLGEVLETGRQYELNEELLGANGPREGGWLTSAKQRLLLERVIADLAAQGSCVIYGHAADAILGNCAAGVMPVFVGGDIGARTARYAAANSLACDEARARIDRIDRATSNYLRHFYRVDWKDSQRYRLMLNTDGLTEAAAAEAIACLAKGLF
jgi:hypothetical protein